MSDAPKARLLTAADEPPAGQWWRSLPEASIANWSDPCRYCGHVRGLHDMAGCRSRSRDLIHAGQCSCTNIGTGSIYHSTLPTAAR